MKYAVTGAGLLGSALAESLRRDGHDVVLIDRVARRGVVTVELRELDRLRAVFEGADGVFHTAAIHGLHEATTVEFLEANVQGTWNVCQAAVDAQVPGLVHASSVGVHGVDVPMHVDCSTPHGRAVSAYDLSKQLAEQIVVWFGATTALSTVALRYGAFAQTLQDRWGSLPDEWARSGAIVDLSDATRATEQAMQRLPLALPAYVVVPTGGVAGGPYYVDASVTERDLGVTFSVSFHAMRRMATPGSEG